MHEQHEKDEICFVGSEYAPEGGGGGGWGFDDEGVAQLRKSLRNATARLDRKKGRVLISPCVSHVLGRTVIWGSECNKVNPDGIEVGGNKGDMSLGRRLPS